MVGEIRIDRIDELDCWRFPAAELFPGLAGTPATRGRLELVDAGATGSRRAE
jgi:hypothetical protein